MTWIWIWIRILDPHWKKWIWIQIQIQIQVISLRFTEFFKSLWILNTLTSNFNNILYYIIFQEKKATLNNSYRASLPTTIITILCVTN